MRVIGIDSWAPPGGTLLTWTVRCRGPFRRSDAPLSFNQLTHLSDTDEGSTWLAASFDVDGPVDPVALERAASHLIDRHGTLRTGFVRRDGSVERVDYPRGSMFFERAPGLRVETPAETTAAVRAALDENCDPFAAPSYMFAAVDRPESSTVVLGFDHAHVDAYSLAVVIDDVRRAYLGEPTRDDAPECFVARCIADAAAEVVPDGDDRLTAWVDFLRARGGAPPQFPLDLGVSEGDTDPCAVRVDNILSASAAEMFDARCRELGSGAFAGLSAAAAHAVSDLGGGTSLPLLFPLHTRRTEASRSAVGWYVTNAPLDVAIDTDLAATIRRAGPSVRHGVTLGEIPIGRVVEAAGGLHRPRKDVFMVSYVDYRRLPGREHFQPVRAHHISNATVADDAQFWFSRTDDGVALRTRYPDNPTARRTVQQFVTRVAHHAGSLVGEQDPSYTSAPDPHIAVGVSTTIGSDVLVT